MRSEKQARNLGPIGVFDSGYGGLTILRELAKALPGHDFAYLGDNARSPYGSRSFETIRRYTLQAVTRLFALGCPLVVLACNTASARALRTLQQRDLPKIAPDRRVLGILRPTTEEAGRLSRTGHVGILGTEGTVRSESYPIEIGEFFPEVRVSQQACPLWVPFVENGETSGEAVEWFVRRDVGRLMAQDPEIDAVILACTHYPLLMDLIEKALPEGVKAVSQGELVAKKLVDYLKRHPEIDERLSKTGSRRFYTTEQPEFFDKRGGIFFGQPVHSEHVEIEGAPNS